MSALILDRDVIRSQPKNQDLRVVYYALYPGDTRQFCRGGRLVPIGSFAGHPGTLTNAFTEDQRVGARHERLRSPW